MGANISRVVTVTPSDQGDEQSATDRRKKDAHHSSSQDSDSRWNGLNRIRVLDILEIGRFG